MSYPSWNWKCIICDLNFPTRRAKQAHNKEMEHPRQTDYEALKIERTCSFCKKNWVTTPSGKSLHSKHCYKNPNRSIKIGTPRTEEEKRNLSEHMKKRHEEGRASRWENPHLKESYAEAFFQKVIDNEFKDKDVSREFRFGKYSFDFAWTHKMKVIEIDGQQHERYAYQRESDARKDKLAQEAGWEILRIKWADLYSNPKHQIATAKKFIDDL